MDLIRLVSKRSRVSDVVYIVLNVFLAAAVLVSTMIYTPPYLAYFLVILSKWRVLAVRPRFWLANIQANAVDLFVGFSVVTLIWQASGAWFLQVVLAILYGVWLLIIKPSSKHRYIVWQAGISQAVSLVALASVAHTVDTGFTVLVGWVIGYISARHVLGMYEDEDTTLVSMAWGFVVAEIIWLCSHWIVAYQLHPLVLIPQMAIITGLLGYTATTAYDAYHKNVLSWARTRASVLLTAAIIAILLLKELAAVVRNTS